MKALLLPLFSLIFYQSTYSFTSRHFHDVQRRLCTHCKTRSHENLIKSCKADNLYDLRSSKSSLRMAVGSVSQGIPAQLVEERDACGVGFIASLSNEPSHDIVRQALDACTCMEHRGGASADGISGDGAGVMTSIPWELFKDVCEDPFSVVNNDGSSATAVAMIFLPREESLLQSTMESIENSVRESNLNVLGWRDVPIDKNILGPLAAGFLPEIKQMVVQAKLGVQSCDDFEKIIYDLRREIQGNFRKVAELGTQAYICSLSSKTIVYKGMLRSIDLPKFYSDLLNPSYKSTFAVYHRRFSTNTIPKWYLAQPMRMLAHNGEINTLLGNVNWVKSRQYASRKTKDGKPKRVRAPLVDLGRSDSANLDSILDSYVKNGMSPEEALMVLVPEAYESQPKLKDQPDVKAFYSYFESIQEAWDGPALLVFSDGNVVGATLDRNGLRPARYMVTSDSSGKELGPSPRC